MHGSLVIWQNWTNNHLHRIRYIRSYLDPCLDLADQWTLAQNVVNEMPETIPKITITWVVHRLSPNGWVAIGFTTLECSTGQKKMYHILTTTFNHQSSISLASFQEPQSFWHPAFYVWWCSFSTTNEGEIQRNSGYRLCEHWGKTIPWHGLSCVFPVSEYVAIKYDETPFKKKMKFGTALGNPKQ